LARTISNCCDLQFNLEAYINTQTFIEQWKQNRPKGGRLSFRDSKGELSFDLKDLEMIESLILSVHLPENEEWSLCITEIQKAREDLNAHNVDLATLCDTDFLHFINLTPVKKRNLTAVLTKQFAIENGHFQSTESLFVTKNKLVKFICHLFRASGVLDPDGIFDDQRSTVRKGLTEEGIKGIFSKWM
jgi:hypothetical protein